jgi:SpoIID/LytB domain protein
MRARFFIPGLLPFVLATVSHAADSQPMPIRIGLCHYFAHATTVLISSASGFTIKDAASGRTLAHGSAKTVYRIAPTDKGLTLTREDYGAAPKPSNQDAPVTVSADSNAYVKVARLDSSAKTGSCGQWHTYRGVLTVRRQPDRTVQIIDTVPLEQYLYGVIPAEIGADVPMEAMKAQAVAARTYALKNRSKFGSEGFDLDDTTRCEGYAGVEGETTLSNAAVDATRGQVLTYHGALIDAPYSTDSGGETACDINGDCPYLQAVRDAPAKDGPDYACTGKYHTWSKEYTPSELSAALARDPRTHVAKFVSLAIDGTDASGRITTATVAGSDGTMKTVTGPQLRQILGYDVLRSTLVTLTVTAEGNYRFDGKGWGHGLGMSQDGAVAMASLPYHHSYKEILEHYYVGTALVHAATLPDISVASAPRGL